MRLAKLIAQRSELSRRAAEKLISDGRVIVDGNVGQIGQEVLADAKITIDGALLAKADKQVYVAFYKPCGYVVTKSDPFEKNTIWKILPDFAKRLNSAGRLDKDSEGLLILTSDGDLIERLTHPRYAVEKTYIVTVKEKVTPRMLLRLKEGIALSDFVAAAKEAQVIETKEESSILMLNLTEGKKREIRRMCRSLGLTILKLVRVSLGPIVLKDLKPGKWRYLDDDEKKKLRNL